MTSRVKGKALAKVPIVGGVTMVLYAQTVFNAVSKKDTKGLVTIAKKWLSNPLPQNDAERCELVESGFVAGTQYLLAGKSANALKLFELSVAQLPQCVDFYFKYLADCAEKLEAGADKVLTKAEAHHLATSIRTALNLVIESEEEPEEEAAEAEVETPAVSEEVSAAKTGPQKPVKGRTDDGDVAEEAEEDEAAEAPTPAKSGSKPARPGKGAKRAAPDESAEVAIAEDDAAESSGTREAVVEVAVSDAQESGERPAAKAEEQAELPVSDPADDEAHDGQTVAEEISEAAEDADDETDEAVVPQEEPKDEDQGEAEDEDAKEEEDENEEAEEEAEEEEDGDEDADAQEEVAEEAVESETDKADRAKRADEAAKDSEKGEEEEADDEDSDEAADEEEAEEDDTAEEADADADAEEAPESESEVHDLQAEGAPADDEGLEMAFEGIEMDDDDEREATRILPASEQAKDEEPSTDFDFPNRADEARFYRLNTAPRVSVLSQGQDIWMDVLILHVPRVNELIEAGKRKRVTKIAIRQFKTEWKAHRRALIRDLSGDAALVFHDILIHSGCRFIEGVKLAAGTSIPQGLLAQGEAHMAEGELDDAIKCFRNFLMHEPCDDVVWYNLGCCYEATEDFAEARRAFDACLALNPTDPDYFLHAGQTAVAENRRLRGHAFLSRAFTLDPELSGVREQLENFDGPLPEQEIEREEIHFDRELFRLPDQWPVLSKGDRHRDEPAADTGLPKLLALYNAERFSQAVGLAEELVAVDRLPNAALLGASCYLGMAGRTPDMGQALPLLRRAAELATVAERERAELFEGWRHNVDQIRGRLRKAAEIYKLPSDGGFSTLAKAFHGAIGSEVSLMPSEVSGTGPKPKPKIRENDPAAGGGKAKGAK